MINNDEVEIVISLLNTTNLHVDVVATLSNPTLLSQVLSKAINIIGNVKPDELEYHHE